MSATAQELTYSVPDMSCDHCRAAITVEVQKLAGVSAVEVDLDTKRVAVVGDDVDDAAVRAAIDDAGFDVA
jgi:copper chaperone CopZ